MTHHMGHSSFGAFAFVAAIAFVFGMQTARIVVGSMLIGVPLSTVIFLWVYGI